MQLRPTPTYGTGFARYAAESAYPELWRGLVGCWVPSLGATGEELLDWSGNRNHGVLTNGPLWVPGALDFNGSGSHVLFNQIIVDENYSISLRFQTDEFNDNTPVGNVSDNKNYIVLDSSIRIAINEDTPALKYFTVPTMNTVDWYDLVITKDGSSNWRLYLDGVESSTGAVNGAGPILVNSIGSGYSNPTFSYDGRISEVMIHNRVLSNDEIAESASPLTPASRMPLFVSVGGVVMSAWYYRTLLQGGKS